MQYVRFSPFLTFVWCIISRVMFLISYRDYKMGSIADHCQFQWSRYTDISSGLVCEVRVTNFCSPVFVSNLPLMEPAQVKLKMNYIFASRSSLSPTQEWCAGICESQTGGVEVIQSSRLTSWLYLKLWNGGNYSDDHLFKDVHNPQISKPANATVKDGVFYTHTYISKLIYDACHLWRWNDLCG